MSAEHVEGDVLAKFLRAFEGQLLELGVEPVEAVLDAQIDVVERALVHDAVLDLVAQHIRVGDAAAVVAIRREAPAADAERRRF
ncbi:MAG: hypothetical protein ACJ8FT_07360 [Sphingomonas sp.]